MDKITKLGAAVKRPQAGELAGRIQDLLAEYDGEMGVAEAVGVLECVKHTLLSRNLERVVDDR